MAQELIDKIRAAAQAKGIDPEVALRIARAESAVNPGAQAKTSSAGGLFQVVDKTWKEFGGKPGKRFDPDENIRVGTDIIASNTNALKKFLNRDPKPAEIYAAHYFGPTGAKSFLTAEPGTPMESLFSKDVIKANPNLKGKTSDQVMATLEKKMGGAPAAPVVSRETPPAPREALPPSLPPMAAAATATVAAAPASTPTRAPIKEQVANLGPGYQAALALSFLADTDEKEDRDIDREPGIAEKWLAEQSTRPSVMAQFSDLSIKSPFAEPQQPQMLADGGEVGEESMPDVGKPTVQEEYMAKVMFPDLPVAEAVYMLRGGNRQSTLQGEMLSGNIGARIPLGKDAEAMLMLTGSRPERDQSSSKAMLAMLNQRLGKGNVGATVVRPMDAPSGLYAGNMSASYPLGEGRISGNVNAMRTPDGQTKVTGYGVGYGGRVGPGDLSAMLMRQKDGPYSGQIEYRLPIGRADGSPEEGERALTPQQIERLAEKEVLERENASKPAFLTPKSGKGRQISTKTGELEAAALQGVTETPYNLFGAPVDLATMVMRPFGYDVEKPIGGSEDLKERALKRGIRQKPPEGAAARALYELTQAGSGLVNPAAPVRGAVAAAEKTGEAAKMLARDFQQYNRQISVPGASYAVRSRGVPVAIMPRSQQKTDEFLLSMDNDAYAAFKEKNPDVAIYDRSEVQATKEFDRFSPPIDEAQVLADNLALTPDQSLNNWFMKALPNYLRTDFATNKDQLVMAAEDNKLLHFAPRKFSDSVEDRLRESFLDRKQPDLRHIRREEINYAEGQKAGSSSGTFGSLAKTEYGQRVEDLTDLSAYMDPIEALSVNRVPPSMRSLSLTAPETRVTDFSPDLVDNLQLDKLRDKMLEIRALGSKPEYSAYGQAPARVPDEFLLPDDTLAKLNVAAASNRVARFTRWQDETRQGMATTALRSDPGFNRRPLQDGKYIAVALPDVDVYPKYMKLVNDVGCDGGWCTQQEGLALTYGSGDARLHVIVTGEGKTARPVAQVSVEKGVGKDGSPQYGISEIKERGDTTDFLNNPALPAIQQYVQELDNVYGGLRFVSDLKALGMKQLPKNPMELLAIGVGFKDRAPLAEKFGTEQAGLAAVRDEVIKLNNGSQYTTGNEDSVAELIRQATRNVLTPQQRATGGMVERQSTDSRKYL